MVLGAWGRLFLKCTGAGRMWEVQEEPQFRNQSINRSHSHQFVIVCLRIKKVTSANDFLVPTLNLDLSFSDEK